uniref:Uncharacterized protein n=1 Tax=Onchocerca volvulus TaxID=6282 RepID=A0A8R1XWT3_ONCVO
MLQSLLKATRFFFPMKNEFPSNFYQYNALSIYKSYLDATNKEQEKRSICMEAISGEKMLSIQ